MNFGNPAGPWGLFIEYRITHDRCDYIPHSVISSNAKADKPNFARKMPFIVTEDKLRTKLP